jgi:hypothetical protein
VKGPVARASVRVPMPANHRQYGRDRAYVAYVT